MAEFKLLKNKQSPYGVFTIDKKVYFIEPTNLGMYLKAITELKLQQKYFGSDLVISKNMETIVFTCSIDEARQLWDKFVLTGDWTPNENWEND